MLDVADLVDLVPDLDERLAYACGPAGLLDALEEHHADRGLALTTERFRTVLARGRRGRHARLRRRHPSRPTAPSRSSTPPRSAGVLMPSGCRMGICMGCVLPLKYGAVRDLRNGALTVAVPGETGPGGVPIQTCINAAAGACTIDH